MLRQPLTQHAQRLLFLRPFMSSTVALAAAALEGMTGGACGQWVAAGISWSYNTFVFWASLAAAASVLKSWCRQRVTFACGVVAGNV
jgi:hypothetical protein